MQSLMNRTQFNTNRGAINFPAGLENRLWLAFPSHFRHQSRLQPKCMEKSWELIPISNCYYFLTNKDVVAILGHTFKVFIVFVLIAHTAIL